MDDRNGLETGGNDPAARWNVYFRRSNDEGSTWSAETQVSAFHPGYTYELATPRDGFLQPYGDYFELDVDSAGRTVGLWGEWNSYAGPGRGSPRADKARLPTPVSTHGAGPDTHGPVTRVQLH
jgi:hypothetical protein